MGRKRKSPVVITYSASPAILNVDAALPALQRFIDIQFETTTRKEITRIFLVEPNSEEIENTLELFAANKNSLSIISAAIEGIHQSKSKTRKPLYDTCIEKGLSDQFASSFLRLVIHFLSGKRFSTAALRQKILALEQFLNHIKASTNTPSSLTIEGLDKDIWLAFLEKMEGDKRTTAKGIFNNVVQIFCSHELTSLGGWLNKLSFRLKNATKPHAEHSSELSDSSYSDVVMFQLLALFIEGFQRRIGYLKRYALLSEFDMPADWIWPSRSSRDWLLFEKGGVNKRVVTAMLESWLSDETQGYQILIDHHIIYHKLGHISGRQRFSNRLQPLRGSAKDLVHRFYTKMGVSHGYRYGNGISMLMSFYLKKMKSNETNLIIDQIAWCLANLFMMQTGVNKEVVLSIPSLQENGISILKRSDPVFLSPSGLSNEVALFGYKERSGSLSRKKIYISIDKKTPLYEMLVEYEKDVKVNSKGPFFEVNKNFIAAWSKAGGIANFRDVYPVIDESDVHLTSINTRRFRKVFATGALLNLLKNVTNGNELADKLRLSLHKKSLDETLSVYLMKSGASRSIIDAAIATITSEKLAEGLKFKGKVALKKNIKVKRRVFLCDCEDPTNPSHDAAFAEECKHYDLCLGCERSVISKENLRYICYRINQYQQAREQAPHLWSGMFEDKFNIALDALDQYALKDHKNGKKLIEEAWHEANKVESLLPPIITSNRM